MPNVRTEIRQRVRDLLAAAMPGHEVISHRAFARNVTSQPLIDLKPANETGEFQTMSSHLQMRDFDLAIRISRQSIEGVEDELDADEAIVTPTLCAAVWGDLCESYPEPTSARWFDEVEGGVGISSLVLQFRFEYRIDVNDLEQPEG